MRSSTEKIRSSTKIMHSLSFQTKGRNVKTAFGNAVTDRRGTRTAVRNSKTKGKDSGTKGRNSRTKALYYRTKEREKQMKRGNGGTGDCGSWMKIAGSSALWQMLQMPGRIPATVFVPTCLNLLWKNFATGLEILLVLSMKKVEQKNIKGVHVWLFQADWNTKSEHINKLAARLKDTVT